MSKLVSGKEVLIALASGEEVEFKCGGMSWSNLDAKQQPLEILIDKNVVFRLKPCTINLNGIEVPAPFKPKVDDEVWFLNDDSESGYGCSAEYDKDIKSYFGWWRTESEIKQVVAALREVFK